MPDVKSILDPLNVPKSVKADAFDAFQSAASSDDLKPRLDKLPLSNSAKADLWDAKHAAETAVSAPAAAPASSGWTLEHNPVSDFFAGVGSGVFSTGAGAYNLARKVPGVSQVLPAPNAYVQSLTQAPDSLAGKAGHFAEQAGEFIVPAGMAAEATKGAGLIARAGAQALAGGGVSAVQSGGDPRATGMGAAIGAAGPVVGAGIQAAAPSLGPAVTRVASQVLGRTTGAGPAAIQQAIEAPTPDLVAAMRGATTEGEVLNNFKDALQNVKDARAVDYQKALANVPQNITLDPNSVRQRVNQMLGQFGVKAGTNGALDFSRSTITDPVAQRQVKNIVADVTDWGSQPGDLTPQGMDTLKRRIGSMFSDDSQASALIASTRDAAASVLKQNVPGYAAMTKNYETATKFIDSLGDLSINSANPGTAIRKLSTVMKSDSDYRRVLTDALSQYSGVDMKGQLAGLALSKAGPQGLAGALDTGVGLLGYVMRGYLSPMAAVSMAGASPRLMGELLVAMGKTAPAIKAAASAATPTVRAIAPGVANATFNDSGTQPLAVSAPTQ
jgi:hypothetical protein